MSEISLKERFSALGNLPRFFNLVWKTSPSLTIINAVLRVVRSAIPVAILYLDQFEDSNFYDKLERARQQTIGRTILLSQVLSQVQDLITMGFLAAGLVIFNPWLILLLFIAVLPAFIGESYFNDRTYSLSRRQTPERRELDYIRYVGASDETAKEVKIFDLSGFLIDRFRQLSGKFYR